MQAPGLGVDARVGQVEWRGERRLKNSIMVLEWCPSVSDVSAMPPSVAVLTEAQSERLKKALTLLDVDQSGDFSHTELSDIGVEKSGPGSYGVLMQKVHLKTKLALSAATPLFKFKHAPKQPSKSHRPLRSKGGGVLRGSVPRLPPRARRWELGARLIAAGSSMARRGRG